ncbi:MAG TPA: acyl-CoA dehydrogenase family protein [Nevskiales bacterium]|nr:acyl-CoA dehydrogenase family protein [Nevskiales bacterium]
MNFALTDDQAMIRDAAAGFLADASNSAAVRRAMASAEGFDVAVWQRIGGELGWCGVAIDEAHGGMGLGPVELVLIQEQAGRRLLCAPFYSSVCVGAPLLQELATDAAQAKYLPRIAAGTLRTAVPTYGAIEEWVAEASHLHARAVGKGWVLEGELHYLMDGASADLLLVYGKLDDGGLGLFAVPRTARGVVVTSLKTWDPTRRFADVKFAGVTAGERIDDPARVDAGVLRMASLARLYLAAEQLGGAQQCLDMTVEYTAGRKQFGRPVAGFQAVKHRCAQMMVQVESLRSAVYGAAALAAGAVDTEALALECAMAKAMASEAFFFCAQEAIQLHGGVGFTWEYDPHLYFKRAQASSHWLGTAEQLRERMAQLLLDSPAA